MIITYFIEDFNLKADYVFQFVCMTIGIKGVRLTQNPKDEVGIYYGNNPKNILYKIRIIEKCEKDDIIWRKLLNGEVRFEGKEIDFDIIHAISLLLTDEVNKGASDKFYDKHERLIFVESFQCKQNIAHIPLVNVYVSFLKSALERNISMRGIALWPHEKKCAIGLSHDVDMPDKYALLKASFSNRSARVSLKLNIYKMISILKRLLDRNPNDFWLFKEIMDEEEKHSFKSTFFFASLNLFDESGSNYDVAYNIDAPKFINVFQEIATRRFEIGLHTSYNAHLDSSRFLIEKQKLIKVSRFEIKGLRHHYWHLGKDVEGALEMHEKAGFEYDSSLAFNEELGFRRNVALPYYPWSETLGRPLKTIQLPVFCMDGNLFCRPIEINQAVEKVKSYIKIIKQYGGIGVIDWHVRTSYPKNTEYLNWGRAYLAILQYLSTDSEVWVTNLGEISSWLKGREKILSSNDNH